MPLEKTRGRRCNRDLPFYDHADLTSVKGEQKGSTGGGGPQTLEQFLENIRWADEAGQGLRCPWAANTDTPALLSHWLGEEWCVSSEFTGSAVVGCQSTMLLTVGSLKEWSEWGVASPWLTLCFMKIPHLLFPTLWGTYYELYTRARPC